jgi:hypothetical protein
MSTGGAFKSCRAEPLISVARRAERPVPRPCCRGIARASTRPTRRKGAFGLVTVTFPLADTSVAPAATPSAASGGRAACCADQTR